MARTPPTERFPAARLKQVRALLHLTQPELAEVMGVSYPSIRMYEAGRAEPGWRPIARLLTATGLPVETFTAGAPVDWAAAERHLVRYRLERLDAELAAERARRQTALTERLAALDGSSRAGDNPSQPPRENTEKSMDSHERSVRLAHENLLSGKTCSYRSPRLSVPVFGAQNGRPHANTTQSDSRYSRCGARRQERSSGSIRASGSTPSACASFRTVRG
jgi:transcriptional regulator with XRE-family HTH domain